ncbi:dihydroxyacetone kinase phosphoryl donor subunit DhaM [Providencia burhodogranariea]|uniref:phosphoenolpyruvate--glycerone phosphotransferase n=1 Tax=Providencia burhodogranariea DSM 19968 TaxID=1141662 RepID=K8X953_9GAMM|nr:dihydroxyacetone kinase phosphoryl donor subunit DhaM [Providencia burhodogranariea]EKT64940.1 dihydroxyacetone kinase subunit M [Providencia burhodogranariea DSM 19968]
MIGLIIVSHSKMLADGLLQLAEQMQNKQNCQIITAAGVDDEAHPIGTDAVKVMEAIEALSEASSIILLMDLGSALLSAETALDLIDPVLAEKVHLCSAPLVEGTIAITAAASGGASIDTILAEARQALQAKQQQLNDNVTVTPKKEIEHNSFSEAAIKTHWVVRNPAGLHIRPAAKLASQLSSFKARLELHNGQKQADAKSMNQIALLQVKKGDKITLIAEGSDSQAAIAAFEQLAQQNFGDDVNSTSHTILIGKAAYIPTVTGLAYHWTPSIELIESSHQGSKNEITKATQAFEQLKSQLNTLADTLTEQYGKSIADIFRGHSLLLDDDDIIGSVKQKIENEEITAYAAILAIFNEMSEQYQQLDDAYLQARFIDIDDLKKQLLMSISSQTAKTLTLAEPTIILSDNLGPSELVRNQNTMIAGIALAKGSPYSHTSIIAAKMGIPMLVNLGENIINIPDHIKITLSTEDSSLTIN